MYSIRYLPKRSVLPASEGVSAQDGKKSEFSALRKLSTTSHAVVPGAALADVQALVLSPGQRRLVRQASAQASRRLVAMAPVTNRTAGQATRTTNDKAGASRPGWRWRETSW